MDSFVADPPTITSGDSTTLRWTTSNALSLTLSNQDFPVDGSFVRSPTATQEYFITAYEFDNHRGREVTESVTVTVEPPEVDSFSISDTSIEAGESVTLSWTTTGATTSVVLRETVGTQFSDTDVSQDGSTTRSPDETTTYQIRVRNGRRCEWQRIDNRHRVPCRRPRS